MDEIVSLVGSLGFPIAVACACIWFLRADMKELKEAVEKNTLATQHLADIVGRRDISS